ncbi:hypothetical protein ACFRAO_17760 [Streptomyces sp. NPDC056656]|uniref:hypothetical protein n=1 Tax=Streptomyces sp. NPDC056656 TaxID=3345895 RepID=UPI0036A11531
MRGRGTACAAVLLVLLAGCGDGGDGGSGARGDGGSKQPSASGVDGTADPAKVFTDAELGAALLPSAALGKGAKATETSLGLFDQGYGGGDWSACAAGRDARGELVRMRGSSAERTVRPDPIVGAGTDRALTLSSAAEAAQRLGKDLYEAS